ncbi:hypothetical protein P5V15_008414 [Pogonomyrmex californicus]
MYYCIVLTVLYHSYVCICQNRLLKHLCHFMEHRESIIRKKWLEALQLENYESTKSAAVCSVYFKNTDYELNHANHKLKKDAVPYEIQPAVQINLDEQNTSIEKNINNETNYESTGTSPDRIINSPTKVKIREIYTREIKAVKRKLSISHYEKNTEEISYSKKYVKESTKAEFINSRGKRHIATFKRRYKGINKA